MAKQRYTSAGTSINGEKLPAIYGKLPKLGVVLGQGLRGLDYGCGKYFESYNLKGMVGYDPFNYDRPENLVNHYDFSVCSNVLNVIAESEIRRDILTTLSSLSDTVYVTVYEGNKSGVGKASKRDCWQENRPLKDYREELEEVFSEVSFKYGVAICRAPYLPF